MKQKIWSILVREERTMKYLSEQVHRFSFRNINPLDTITQVGFCR